MQFGPFYAAGATDAGELAAAEKLKALFDAVDGVEAEVVEDMQTARWTKVIWVRPPPSPLLWRHVETEALTDHPCSPLDRTPRGTRRRRSSRPTQPT